MEHDLSVGGTRTHFSLEIPWQALDQIRGVRRSPYEVSDSQLSHAVIVETGRVSDR